MIASINILSTPWFSIIKPYELQGLEISVAISNESFVIDGKFLPYVYSTPIIDFPIGKEEMAKSVYVFYDTELLKTTEPIPVAAQSKAWIFDRSPAGIASSNPAGVMEGCLLWVLYFSR